jgi:hypothetical protein
MTDTASEVPAAPLVSPEAAETAETAEASVTSTGCGGDCGGDCSTLPGCLAGHTTNQAQALGVHATNGVTSLLG